MHLVIAAEKVTIDLDVSEPANPDKRQLGDAILEWIEPLEFDPKTMPPVRQEASLSEPPPGASATTPNR